MVSRNNCLIVVLAIVGFAGYWVYHDNHKPKPAAAVGPYVGWKTFCDSSTKPSQGCFKTPSDWTNGAGFITQGPADAEPYILEAGFNNETNQQSNQTATFYTANIEPMPDLNGLYIVGGFFSSASLRAGYQLVTESTIKQYSLTVGQTSNVEFPFRCVYNNIQCNLAVLFANQPSQTQTTTDPNAQQAQAWYGTASANQALLIIKSFYRQ